MWLIIFFGFIIASWIINALLNRRFKKYSEVSIALTGREVAEKMLRDNGIYDVKVTCTPGHLTDHYNPTNKTINLSDSVYNSANIAAAAVAAHECGHALQHANSYEPLRMRSALVPIVSFSSQWISWVLVGGILLIETVPSLLTIGVVLYGITTLFSIVTLPVEINASNRAIAWLESAGITNYQTTPMASSALRSAAYTYILAALMSLATLIRYILILTGRDD